MTDIKRNDAIRVSCEMIVQKEDKILMGKRGMIFGKGSWALPGGHMEIGEISIDCAKRELEEETGLIPTKINLIGIINDLVNLPDQANQYVRFIYLIEDFTGEIVNKEPDLCDGWEWFSLGKLPEPIFVGHVKVIEYFLSDRKTFVVEK